MTTVKLTGYRVEPEYGMLRTIHIDLFTGVPHGV